MFTDPTCFYVTIFKRLQDQIPHYKICDQAENKKVMEKDPLQNAKMAATWDAIQWKAKAIHARIEK